MPSADATTVIVGVGYTGRRLLERLDSTQVIGLGRSAPTSETGTRIERIDLDDGVNELPVDLPSNYDVVYTVPPARDHATDVRLENLLALLSPAPAHFVYLSTTGVYGNRDGGIVDETATPAPQSGRAQRRVAAENGLNRWAANAGTAAIVLRVPGIYGPDRLGIERIRQQEAVLREEDANPGNRIHVDDLVSCCIAALDAPAGMYNVGDGDSRSSSWFASEVARQSGLDVPPMVSRAEAEVQFSALRMSFLNESRRLDLTRMREVLRPALKYGDAAYGIRASLPNPAAPGREQ